MRATAVVALLLHALPGAHGAANATFVRGPEGLLAGFHRVGDTAGSRVPEEEGGQHDEPCKHEYSVGQSHVRILSGLGAAAVIPVPARP